jgi:hypothetical protein
MEPRMGRKKSFFSHSMQDNQFKDIPLFSHLETNRPENVNYEGIPSSVRKLGLMYKEHKIVGSNARTKALLRC